MHNSQKINDLVQLASLAPSGDNTQPWLLQLLEPNLLRLKVDPSRDPSPMNYGQRMARIGIGAFVESLEFLVHPKRVELADVTTDWIDVRLPERFEASSTNSEILAKRVTNRRHYRGPLPPLNPLTGFEELGVSSKTVSDAAGLSKIGSLIGNADAEMFKFAPARRAFLKNVFFKRRVEWGLPARSLELPLLDRLALPALRLPTRFLRAFGVFRKLGQHSRKLVLSSPGVVGFFVEDDRFDLDFIVGRAVQRVWLQVVAEGAVAQPMMSLCVLENMSRDPGNRLDEVVCHNLLSQTVECFGKSSRLAFLMRIGYADDASDRAGRLKVRVADIRGE